MLSTPPHDPPAATDAPNAFGLRPPLDDHARSDGPPSTDDRGWAAWLVIILLAAVTLRGLMLVFGGGAGEVVELFTSGEPAVVAPADRTPQPGPVGLDRGTAVLVATGLAELEGVGVPTDAANRDGYSRMLGGAAQLGLPAGAVLAVQTLLGLGVVVLAFAVGRRFGGVHEEDAYSADRVGLIAAAVVAVHPAVFRAGGSLEPTLWSAAGLLLAVYLLTSPGKRRVKADGSSKRDWAGLLVRSAAAGLSAAVAVVIGGIDTGLVYPLLVCLGIGLGWWAWQRERDGARRRAKDLAEAAPTDDGTPQAAQDTQGWRLRFGVFAAVAVSTGLWLGIAALVPGVIDTRGEPGTAINDWQTGAATRLAWATHNPSATPQANAGAALAMVRGPHESRPDASAYAIADAVSWSAMKEAPSHTSWRVQRDAWRAALTPDSRQVVARFGVEPTGQDRVAGWLGVNRVADATTDQRAQTNGVLTAVGLLWVALNFTLLTAAGLGLALLTARRRWGEAVCLGLLLTAVVAALVLGDGQRGAIGLLGLTACGWSAAGLVLPRRAVQRRKRRRRKSSDGPAGIAGAGGLLSVAMAVNPGDDELDGETPRGWRNLWGWWSAGDRDSHSYRAARLPLTGGQGLPVASPAPDTPDTPEEPGAMPTTPGVEVLEATVEEPPALIAGGRPL